MELAVLWRYVKELERAVRDSGWQQVVEANPWMPCEEKMDWCRCPRSMREEVIEEYRRKLGFAQCCDTRAVQDLSNSNRG